MRTYAIIPARSGSKGVPNKNIRPINGIELMGYSIAFAKTLPVERVICSTDSLEYARIARKHGAEVPFLRSEYAASDTAMEQDIIVDLENNFSENGIVQPDLYVWLRPTFVFRQRDLVIECIKRLVTNSSLTACRVVTSSESRLYKSESGLLAPLFNDYGRSMVRRQDVDKAFRVYSTDVFRATSGNHGVAFLGDRIGYVEAPKICSMDIDDDLDFQIVDLLVTHKHDMIREYISV